MKVEFIRDKQPEPPITRVDFSCSVEEAAYIRWLAGAGLAVGAGGSCAIERLYSLLNKVKDVPVDGTKCFL